MADRQVTVRLRVQDDFSASVDRYNQKMGQAEQIAALKAKLDTNVTRQLTAVLNQLASEGEARIVARAETFHGDGTGDAAGVPGDGLDAGAV